MLGPTPPTDMYMPETMSKAGKAEFDRWYEAQVADEAVLDMHHDKLDYCISDVKLLKQGCPVFCREFQERTWFCPFEKMTITGVCLQNLRLNRMENDTIASEPLYGWRHITNHSKVAMEWLLFCGHALRRDAWLAMAHASRLVSLNLLPISYWLECRDLLFLYKGVNGLLNFPLSNFIRFSTGRTRSAASSLNLRHFLRFHTSLFRDSYFITIVYLWNDLPLSIRQTPSIKLCKTRLYEHYLKKLDCDFETDRIRAWKTICPVVQ